MTPTIMERIMNTGCFTKHVEGNFCCARCKFEIPCFMIRRQAEKGDE